MSRTDSIMELVSGYDKYAATSDLSDVAATDAPATTWYCAAAGLTLLTAATYEATC
ncbi:MAG TPA: hypothetical protein H9800_11005 [Candidatus Microbacterium stercoravium]|uniref:Uncharacterized protein n=1 Tax=Candidatus Microbacterium stercoravium TaxID=2838697 RepID=A0A9D2H7U1_9MICO|nr:hypothetical protein [Candidatus Microbacterium stercoravium]